MEYSYTVDKFNRGFHVGGGGGGENLDEKLQQLENQISDSVEDLIMPHLNKNFNDFNNRISAIENIGQMYSVTDTYFSTKGRRIVSVSPAKDKTDVIIKRQLDNAIDKLEKKIDAHIKVFNTYKTYVDQELVKLRVNIANQKALESLNSH